VSMSRWQGDGTVFYYRVNQAQDEESWQIHSGLRSISIFSEFDIVHCAH
jgi:hypothetical protein